MADIKHFSTSTVTGEIEQREVVAKAIPKQRNVTILPQFAIVDKSSYHTARINVSRNAFLNSRPEEKNIFFDVHTG